MATLADQFIKLQPLDFKSGKIKMRFLPAKKPDTMKHRQWDFPVAHPSMISVNEVTKYLARDNPIAFIVIEDSAFCYIHPSIYKKSEILSMGIKGLKLKIHKSAGVESCATVQINKTQIKTVIKWAKKVKKAPWEGCKTPKKVQVIFPRI